ncbi:MAG TPA: NmrA family NAD(P)-binding protein [Bellilinea sp.]|nr:NmrA family NAD(P)-binding protein [Bellilinea sp.]
MKKILVTGASGKTGQAILRNLADNADFQVRGMIRSLSKSDELFQSENLSYEAGDFASESDLIRCLEGVDSVYHICPNMAPDELEIGMRMIRAAKESEISHFVFHSVMHPQIQEMQHHWSKLLVEEQLFKSGLPFTVVQPAAYMQNLLGYWDSITHRGIYKVPYSAGVKFTNIDLTDLAEAVSIILYDADKFKDGIYELAGPDRLSSADMMDVVSRVGGIHAKVELEDLGVWEASMRQRNMSDYSVRTLLGMFDYYNKYGFTGSSAALKWILGRQPATFEEFIKRIICSA